MQVASDDEETQKQGIVFIFMLALRAVTGHQTHLHPSTSTASLTTSVAVTASTTAATATTTEKIPSDNNIFARTDSADSGFGYGSASSSDNGITGGSNSNDSTATTTTTTAVFSPHETSHRHNHTMKRIRILSKVFRYGPVRVGAIHVCSPNRPELQHIKFDLLQVLEKNERVRTRFHNGMFINVNVVCHLLSSTSSPSIFLVIIIIAFVASFPSILYHLLYLCPIQSTTTTTKRNINGMFDIIESSGDTNRSFTT